MIRVDLNYYKYMGCCLFSPHHLYPLFKVNIYQKLFDFQMSDVCTAVLLSFFFFFFKLPTFAMKVSKVKG